MFRHQGFIFFCEITRIMRMGKFTIFPCTQFALISKKSAQYLFSIPAGKVDFLPVAFRIDPYDGIFLLLLFLLSLFVNCLFLMFVLTCGQRILYENEGCANKFCREDVAVHSWSWSSKVLNIICPILISFGSSTFSILSLRTVCGFSCHFDESGENVEDVADQCMIHVWSYCVESIIEGCICWRR